MPTRFSAALWLPVVMMRRQFVLLLPVLPLSLLVIMAMAAGRALPPLAASLVAGDCAQPCWQGLQPGQMNAAEALALIEARELAADPLPVSAAQLSASLSFKTANAPTYNASLRFSYDQLQRIDLFPQEPVTLGDVFSAFGPPSHARLCQTGTVFAGSLSAMLYYFEGQVEVWAYRPLPNQTAQPAPPTGLEALLTEPLQRAGALWRVSPAMEVIRITYRGNLLQIEGLGPLGASPWTGFGRVEQVGFCQ